MPSLIDALTGAPGPAFPPDGSEVVGTRQFLQDPRTKVDPSLGSLRFALVFVKAFSTENYTTKPLGCQPENTVEEGGGFSC